MGREDYIHIGDLSPAECLNCHKVTLFTDGGYLWTEKVEEELIFCSRGCLVEWVATELQVAGMKEAI